MISYLNSFFCSFTVSSRSMHVAAYECITKFWSFNRFAKWGKAAWYTSFGSCWRKVVINLMHVAFKIGLVLDDASSGRICALQNSTIGTNWFVETVPDAEVTDFTARAVTRYTAVSFATQFPEASMLVISSRGQTRETYVHGHGISCAKSCVTLSSKCLRKPFTSSSAALRLVSVSLPSASRLGCIYIIKKPKWKILINVVT